MKATTLAATLFLLVSIAHAVSGDDAAAALLELKSTLRDDLQHLSSWVEGSDPCNWRGVGCSPENQSIIALNLGGFNLSGSISPLAISKLTSLANLSLELNDFGGAELPMEIFTDLPVLAFVNISHCNFTGEFPANLSSARSLETLDAYNNNFSGPLPLGLSLTRLAHLHLGGSFFTGSIPSEYGSIANLKFLALSGNGLTGAIPPELGKLANLEHLYLGYFNNFSGPQGIPRELSQLKSLVRLDLGNCNLEGGIPEELGMLRSLDSLFLQLNSLTGTIPATIGKLEGLRSLDLSCNQLTGEIPGSFVKLVQLQLLSLFQNDLSGAIPSFVGDMPNLEVLYMWENRFEGPIPAQLGGSQRLMLLDLSKNSLNGSIPPSLCDGGQLNTLILQENQLTGAIPESLGSCQSLARVRIGYNSIAGLIPAGFFSLPSLDRLELIQNRITGFGEGVVFSGGSPLAALDVRENLIRGDIPDALSGLQNLQVLDLAWNRFTGPLPENLTRLRQLSKLNASHNLLTGGIPPGLGSLPHLSTLDLSSNQLSGVIPQTIGAFDQLNLSRNLLTGEIPHSLKSPVMDLSFNRLSGQIPPMDNSVNQTAFLGNPGLCGYPLAATCPTVVGGSSRRGHHGWRRGDSGLLAWLVGALFSAALLVLVVGICCFFRKYRFYICGLLWRERGGGRSHKSWKLTAFQRLDFTATQIVECMNEDNIIGRGGSGTVYKGVIPASGGPGAVVAVKRLSGLNVCQRKGSNHGDHGFSAEVQTLGKIRHRNIVKLLGFCSNKETNVLVYEFMPNGSLGEALHGRKGAMLDWGIRYKIALQAANGLCYLHHDCSPLIVHRDVKSNNILLDEEYRAHVADFGLAKLFLDSGKSESMSSIAGSYGYIAPEYAYTLKVNEKSDIYSFGVVLLELVTGKRPIEPEYGDGVDIVQWVRKKIQSKDGVLELLDSRIRDENLPLQEIMLVLRVALLCTSDLPVDRPTMRDVVQMLSDAKPGKWKQSSSDFGEFCKFAHAC